MLRNLKALPLAILLATHSPLLYALDIKPLQPNLWLAQDSSLPLVAMTAVIKYGGDAYGAKASTATLAAMVLKNGGGEYNSAEFAQRLEELSIRLGFASSDDTFTISIQTLSQHKQAAFSLLGDALASPNFTAQELTQAQKELVAVADFRKQDPPALARLYFYQTLFKDHPYGRDALADPMAVTEQDIRSFIAKLTQNPVAVGIAGDISPTEAMELVANLPFEALSAQKPSQSAENPPKKASKEKGSNKRLLPPAPFRAFSEARMASLPQAAGVFALKGLAVSDEDYLALALVNRIFGGGFGSRLVKSIREERGLVYAIGAYSNNLEALPLVVGSFQSNSPDEVSKLLRQQISKIVDGGITAEELKRAKAYLTGSLAVNLTKLSAIANFAAFSIYYGRKPDYLATREAKINGVTLSQANSLIKRLWGGDQLALLVLGQPQNP